MPVPRTDITRARLAKAPDAEPAPLGDEDGGDYLPLAPGSGFIYTFYPDDPGNWVVGEVDGVAYWLPALSKLHLVPGQGGVRTLRKGERQDTMIAEAIAGVTKRGGIAISRDHGYLMRTPARHPNTGQVGHIYHDRFETPKVPRGRRMRTVKFHTDSEARNVWLLSLITEGHIPAPDPELLDHNRAVLADRVRAKADRRGVSLPSDLGVLSEDDRKRLPKYVTDAASASEVAEEAAVPEYTPPATAKRAAPTKRATKRKAAKPPAAVEATDLGVPEEGE